ncbi:MAG: hypothetical protein ACREP8_12285 [Candidatus Binatia bacterium]
MFPLIILFAAVMAALLLVPKSRARLLEQAKAASDAVLIWCLRATSQFGNELTEEGKAEQKLWREQRLRNLQGLTLRSRQRWGEKPKV